MARTKDVIELCGVGDVILNREDPPSMFHLVKPVFEKADIVFGNCESTYSDRGARNPICRGGGVRGASRNVAGLKWAGFHVMNFATNHHMDWGYEAFSDTLDLLKGAGIATCGAGKDEDEARKPAIVEKKGIRVAFVGYAPVTFLGYEAGPNKPGSAPLRVYTYYKQVEHEQPGTVPDILTFADKENLEAMRQDIAKARTMADIVVPTFHWGLHFAPVLLAQYQFEVGHAAIDAGGDLVLGHHQHILKGVEVYKGKVIFHGLGNFGIDVYTKEHASSPSYQEMIHRYGERALRFQPDYPTYAFHPDARQNIIAKAYMTKEGVTKVSYVPGYINPKGQTEPLKPGDGKFEKVKGYMDDITRQAGLDTKFAVEDGEVTVLVK